MKIRNEMGFWTEDSDLYFHLKEHHGCNHPDDMSMKILEGVYDKLITADTL